jgi:hypothetical protein
MSLLNIENVIINIDNIDDITDIYIKLIEQFDRITVDLYLYHTYQYLYNDNDDNIDEIKRKRVKQILFRKKLINRYNVCIITGADEIVCKACHIIDFSKCNINDKYNVNNGLLMRLDLHILFDLYKLIIDINTLTIKLTDDILLNENMSDYRKYNNKQINIHEDSIIYLKQFYNLN